MNNNGFPPMGIMSPELTPEEKKEMRRKEIAHLKASQQLLMESAESIEKSERLSADEKRRLGRMIGQAMREEQSKAAYAGVTQEELDNVQYTEASEESKRRYEEYLKRHGKTHEDIARKDVATMIANADKAKKNETRRRRRNRISGLVNLEGIERVPDEEKIMKQSLISEDLGDKENNSDKEKREREEKDLRDHKEKLMEMAQEDNVRPSSVVVNNPDKGYTSEAPVINGDFKPFSADDVEEDVVYDLVPLPSKGQCYPYKVPSLAVAEITASDENLIAAPQMYRDGKIIDVLLERKILDKNIKPVDLCKGDREAILLWLRLSSYGPEYPIYATNPETGKRYEVEARLDQFDYKPFNLKGDENGHFEWIASNGDVFKFRYLTNKDEEELKDTLIKDVISLDTLYFMKDINNIRSMMRSSSSLTVEAKSEMEDCLKDMVDILSENGLGGDEAQEEVVLKSVTEQMIMSTVSINDISDRDFVRHHIEHMRAGDARKYRTYIADNRPGVDFSMSVNIPQSDGGGSFDTFLRLEDTLFLNV